METKLTTNFTKGDGTPKIGFIIHGTLGSYAGAVDWLYQPCANRNPVTYSSAHYVIGKDGRVTQLVKNEDVSWHAGIISNPIPEAKALLPKTLLGSIKNPNQSFIGIENEWFVGDTITEQQYQAMVKIIQDSGIKNPILLTHKQITDYKSDFMTPDGKMDTSVIEELKKRLATVSKLTKQDVITKMTELINNL